MPGKPLCVLLFQLDNNDMKMWTDPALSPRQWLDHAKANFDQVYREGEEGNSEMMSLGLHLRIIGRRGHICALEEFFKHVRANKGVWITTHKAIADHFMEMNPA